MKMKIKIKKRAASAAVMLILLILSMCTSAFAAETEVYPGGMPFGVRFGVGKLIVSGFCSVETEKSAFSPAKQAGMTENDIIMKINGKQPKNAEDVTKTVKQSNGEPIAFTVKRGEKQQIITVKPEKSQNGEYRIGLWLRDGSAGIGTVTFIIPETGAFGGLGHGICDADTGELCPISHGVVSHVTIKEINKGIPGQPGELRGLFEPKKCGSVTANTSFGVFGVLTDAEKTKTVKTADKIKEGNATVVCTLGDAGKGEYSVRLTKNPDGSGDTFFVEVTDPNLLSLTGGIVQGMSGSPLFQDGKLVGAVTHVLINDPTRGYGITIEKMLNSMPESLK